MWKHVIPSSSVILTFTAPSNKASMQPCYSDFRHCIWSKSTPFSFSALISPAWSLISNCRCDEETFCNFIACFIQVLMWQSAYIKILAQSSYPLAITISRAVLFWTLIFGFYNGVQWQFINMNTSPFNLSVASNCPNIFNATIQQLQTVIIC